MAAIETAARASQNIRNVPVRTLSWMATVRPMTSL
jgi:hypothetical protein